MRHKGRPPSGRHGLPSVSAGTSDAIEWYDGEILLLFIASLNSKTSTGQDDSPLGLDRYLPSVFFSRSAPTTLATIIGDQTPAGAPSDRANSRLSTWPERSLQRRSPCLSPSRSGGTVWFTIAAAPGNSAMTDGGHLRIADIQKMSDLAWVRRGFLSNPYVLLAAST